MHKFKCEVTKCDCSSQLDTDLGEDAGSGGDSAVHHTVENGEQAVQREGLWAQKVVARLKRETEYIDIIILTGYI